MAQGADLKDKQLGRALQELDEQQLAQVGRLLGRLHNVGASHPAPHRPQLLPREYAEPALAAVLSSGLCDPQLQGRYERAARAVIAAAAPLFVGVPLHRVHGDCHGGNLLWQSSGPFFLDFDDLLLRFTGLNKPVVAAVRGAGGTDGRRRCSSSDAS